MNNVPTRCLAESLERARHWVPWKEVPVEKGYEVTYRVNGPSVVPNWRVALESDEHELFVAYCFTEDDAKRVAAALNAQPRVRVQ